VHIIIINLSLNYLRIYDIIIGIFESGKKLNKRQGIFIDYQHNENYDGEYDENKDKKQSWMWRWFKRIVYLMCILILLIVVFRLISTGDPKELKNYIAKNEKIERAYANLKDDFVMYRIDIRNAFALGDALFADKIYYLESAENLQLTVRCKNNRMADINSDLNSLIPFFKYYLKVSVVDNDIAADEIDEYGANSDYVFLEADQTAFGKDTDRYRYFVLSFDDVKIDYAKTKVELYMCGNGADFDAQILEDEYIARFTLFDINMPKTKMQVKKFKLN